MHLARSREKETVAVVRLETSLPGVESRLARAAGPKHRRDEMRRGKKSGRMQPA